MFPQEKICPQVNSSWYIKVLSKIFCEYFFGLFIVELDQTEFEDKTPKTTYCIANKTDTIESCV